MRVKIQPMPRDYIGKFVKPRHPPIFPNGKPTQADIEEAKALFAELDEESKLWYRKGGIVKDFDAYLDRYFEEWCQ